MNFTFDHSLRYYSYRLPDERITPRESQQVRCPFHADRSPSMSLSMADGEWYCHACKEGGGIYQFEAKMFPGRTPDECWEQIGKICGLEPPSHGKQERGPLIATHKYYFANGHLAFEKMRYAPKDPGARKSFVTRMPEGRGWVYHLRNLKEKPLYNLPAVVTSNVILVVEGEKKADVLNAIDWTALVKPNGTVPKVAATCNFDGAGGWLDAYSPFMAGKKVFIFPDNDEVGRNHAQEVARSVSKYAVSVHIVDLPGLDEHGDVADFMETHTPKDLIAQIKQARLWASQEVEKPTQPWLVPASLMVVDSGRMEWLVDGVVHAYSKGIFVAGPKAGKSLTALDMCVALALNQSWCGCRPLGRQVRCAVISREDPSFITQNRTFDFAKGRGFVPGDLEEWLYFNTRDQSSTFYLEKDEDCKTAIKWIKEKRIEFAVFDVLNLLHGANENSNTEMTAVMKKLSMIRDETNISLALIHHTPHSDPKRARGAGAIESWWEWKVVVKPDAQDDAIKTMDFISKACRPHPPITIAIREEMGGTRLVHMRSVNFTAPVQTWQSKQEA